MKYTRVRRAVSAVMIDSYDEDRNPELVKVNGTVTFTPLLKDGDVVQWAGPNGPQSLVLAPIECFISNGIIMHRGGEGIFLAAGGPGVQPDVIQWKATFKNMQAGGWAFNLKPVMFDAVPDGEVDLTLVSPIAGASEPILRGPAGVGLKSITVEGSELVVTVTSEAGTYVMSRIPLEDVVRAEADQAVASAQAAIKADVDAAAASASAAKSSEDAAAASATDAQNAASQTVATAQDAIKADVDAAAASASSAQASASTATTQAETATTQAGTAMEQANAADMSAENAKTYAANAKASETSAGESAATASSEADRAKTEADRAAQKATEVANTVEGNYAPIGHHHPWSEIDDKPATFPPAEHTHTTAQVEGLDSALAGKAEATHSHALADVTGLQAALNGKANTSHTHTTAQVTGLDTALAGKAAQADLVALQQKLEALTTTETVQINEQVQVWRRAGIVTLRLIGATKDQATDATIPVGYRPKAFFETLIKSDADAKTTIGVKPDGSISIYNSSAGATLNGIITYTT